MKTRKTRAFAFFIDPKAVMRELPQKLLADYIFSLPPEEKKELKEELKYNADFEEKFKKEISILANVLLDIAKQNNPQNKVKAKKKSKPAESITLSFHTHSFFNNLYQNFLPSLHSSLEMTNCQEFQDLSPNEYLELLVKAQTIVHSSREKHMLNEIIEAVPTPATKIHKL